MKRFWPILLLTAGCSSAPIADTLDWLRPGHISGGKGGADDGPPRIPPVREGTPPIDPLDGPAAGPIGGPGPRIGPPPKGPAGETDAPPLPPPPKE